MAHEHMLFVLVVAHFLCDFPLQGDFLAKAKNPEAPLPGVPWQWAMLAHAAIHAGAVLAKILFEDAPKLRTVRPELPLPLEDLLLRMLHKDPKLRPADGGAVLAALLLLPTLPTLQGPAFEHAVVGPSIRGSEQQLVSVLLVSDVLEVSSQQTLAEADDAAQKARLEALRAHLAPSGLHLEQLVDGSLLGTMHQLGSGAATDLAGRAARAAFTFTPPIRTLPRAMALPWLGAPAAGSLTWNSSNFILPVCMRLRLAARLF